MSASTDVRGQLTALAAPLENELRSIDAQIKALSEELDELREARRDVAFVLVRLNPSLAKPKKKRGWAPRGGTRAPEILDFIESHNGDFADGIIYTKLFGAMKAEGIAIGKDKVKAGVLELHESGVLRLDRKTMGGGNSYKLVGDGD